MIYTYNRAEFRPYQFHGHTLSTGCSCNLMTIGAFNQTTNCTSVLIVIFKCACVLLPLCMLSSEYKCETFIESFKFNQANDYTSLVSALYNGWQMNALVNTFRVKLSSILDILIKRGQMCKCWLSILQKALKRAIICSDRGGCAVATTVDCVNVTRLPTQTVLTLAGYFCWMSWGPIANKVISIFRTRPVISHWRLLFRTAHAWVRLCPEIWQPPPCHGSDLEEHEPKSIGTAQ